MKKLALLLLLVAVPCQAQGKARHDLRNADTEVVDSGHVEIETDIINDQSETGSPLDTTIHYGLTNNFELQLSLSPKGNDNTIIGDTEISVRKQMDTGRWHIGLQPFVVIPGKNSSSRFQFGTVTDIHYQIGKIDVYASPQFTVDKKMFISQLYGSSYQVTKYFATRVEMFNNSSAPSVWYVGAEEDFIISKHTEIDFRINKAANMPAEDIITLVIDF